MLLVNGVLVHIVKNVLGPGVLVLMDSDLTCLVECLLMTQCFGRVEDSEVGRLLTRVQHDEVVVVSVQNLSIPQELKVKVLYVVAILLRCARDIHNVVAMRAAWLDVSYRFVVVSEIELPPRVDCVWLVCLHLKACGTQILSERSREAMRLHKLHDVGLLEVGHLEDGFQLKVLHLIHPSGIQFLLHHRLRLLLPLLFLDFLLIL